MNKRLKDLERGKVLMLRLFAVIAVVAIVFSSCSSQKSIYFGSLTTSEALKIYQDSAVKRANMGMFESFLSGIPSINNDTLVILYRDTNKYDIIKDTYSYKKVESQIMEPTDSFSVEIYIDTMIFGSCPYDIGYFSNYFIINDSIKVNTSDFFLKLNYKVKNIQYAIYNGGYIVADYGKINLERNNNVKIVVTLSNIPFKPSETIDYNLVEEKYLIRDQKLILIRNDKYGIYVDFETWNSKRELRKIFK